MNLRRLRLFDTHHRKNEESRYTWEELKRINIEHDKRMTQLDPYWQPACPTADKRRDDIEAMDAEIWAHHRRLDEQLFASQSVPTPAPLIPPPAGML